MKISARARYGLSALICIACQYNTSGLLAVAQLSENLGISKIYLEQTFSILKLAGLVSSEKGSQGGYRLSRPPSEISIYEILSAVDTALAEKTKETVTDKPIEFAMQRSVFAMIDQTLQALLSDISLEDLVIETNKAKTEDGYMYHI